MMKKLLITGVAIVSLLGAPVLFAADAHSDVASPCKKAPEPPKGKDGKPLPPPTGKDGKPLPPPGGKEGKPMAPPKDKDGKPLPPPQGEKGCAPAQQK